MQFSKPKVSTEVSPPAFDRPASRRRPGGGGGSNDLPKHVVVVMIYHTDYSIWDALTTNLSVRHLEMAEQRV